MSSDFHLWTMVMVMDTCAFSRLSRTFIPYGLLADTSFVTDFPRFHQD